MRISLIKIKNKNCNYKNEKSIFEQPNYCQLTIFNNVQNKTKKKIIYSFLLEERIINKRNVSVANHAQKSVDDLKGAKAQWLHLYLKTDESVM